MHSKLTLSINEAVVRRAKRYAKSRGKSLSKVIEQYLAHTTRYDGLLRTEVTEEVARLSDRLPPSAANQDVKYEYLAEKHLRDTHIS